MQSYLSWASILCFLFTTKLWGYEPAAMGAFQRGPLGYGQAFIKRDYHAFEALTRWGQRSGVEDSILTSVSGRHESSQVEAGSYYALSPSLHALAGVEFHNKKSYFKSRHDTYRWERSFSGYTVESGVHLSQDAWQYGGKVALTIDGGESRGLKDAINDLALVLPEHQATFLKLWLGHHSEFIKWGVTLHTEAISRSKPKSASLTSVHVREYAHGEPNALWFDMSLKHSENTNVALGMRWRERQALRERVYEVASHLNVAESETHVSRNMWSFLIGGEHLLFPALWIYASAEYFHESYSKDEYASLILDNLNHWQIHTGFSLKRSSGEYYLGFSYLLPTHQTVDKESMIKPWVSKGDPVKIRQNAWEFTFSVMI